MPSAGANAPNSSGITTSTAGDRHIPSSVRADGSIRKEIKVRPGYKPPEDVEVYKNRTAEAWKARGSGGVPGATAAAAAAAAVAENSATKTGSKNAKRREARKRAKAAEEGSQDEAVEAVGEANVIRPSQSTTKPDMVSEKDSMGKSQNQQVEQPPSSDPEVEKEKQARNLKKKLRQARELREKKNRGQNLLPEQFEKVIKISELIRQLDSLGFDAEGNPK